MASGLDELATGDFETAQKNHMKLKMKLRHGSAVAVCTGIGEGTGGGIVADFKASLRSLYLLMIWYISPCNRCQRVLIVILHHSILAPVGEGRPLSVWLLNETEKVH